MTEADYASIEIIVWSLTFLVLGLIAMSTVNTVLAGAKITELCKIHTWRYKDDRGWLNDMDDYSRLQYAKLTCVLCKYSPESKVRDLSQDDVE